MHGDTETASNGGDEAALDVRRRAFEAWEQGEHTGDYTAFRGLLGEITVFSHPYLGRHMDAAAGENLRNLMAGREAEPNRLTFSRVTVAAGPGVAVCLFDSSGLIAGTTQYSRYNAIAFHVEDGRVTGFREYFGTS